MGNSSKTHLEQRVNQYYSHLIKGEYGLSWDLIWKDAKRKRNRVEWTAFARQFDEERKLTGIKIKSISIKRFMNRKIGTVKGIGIYEDIKQKKITKYEDEEYWIFESGDWFKMIE